MENLLRNNCKTDISQSFINFYKNSINNKSEWQKKVSKEAKFIRRKWKYYHYNFINLRNDGNSWRVTADEKRCEVNNDFKCDFVLEYVAGQWGEGDRGSDYTIGYDEYATGEIHLVHWNKTKYSNINEASKFVDGICKIVVLLKLGKSHSELQKIIKKIPCILHANSYCELSSPIYPKSLLPNCLNYNMFLKKNPFKGGSKCIWILFKEPIEISKQQIETFRSLRNHSEEFCVENCAKATIINYLPPNNFEDTNDSKILNIVQY